MLYILSVLVTMTVEALHPEWVVKLSESRDSGTVYVIISYTTALIFVMMLAFVFISLYNHHQKKIRELTVKDHLTQQYNRRYTLNRIEQLYQHKRQALENKFAVFIDVDEFKAINDRYGHNEGDRVLCELCDIINNNIRKNDFLARMGGDEFLLIISAQNVNKASVMVKRIVETVADAGKITISAGLTQLKGKKDMLDLLEKADHSMYEVKNNGKNGYFYIEDEQ